MQPTTVYRLAMLENGFEPVLAECKRPVEPAWQIKSIDKAEVFLGIAAPAARPDCGSTAISPRSTSTSRTLIWSRPWRVPSTSAFPRCSCTASCVTPEAPKEAWIARVDEPFRRLASRRWYRGNDPDDPAEPKHLVECFGSRGTRHLGVDGPHARDRAGNVVSHYQFVGGACPATMPRASLPVLPKAAYAQVCDLFDAIAAAAGLNAVATASGEAAPTCFELDADTEIETRDHGVMTVAELERFMRARPVRRQRAGDVALLGHLSRFERGSELTRT